MTVVVQYIVVRNGEQKMTFATKKEADAYDRMLDIAEAMGSLIRRGELGLDESQIEEISLHLAKHGDEAMSILKGKSLSEESAKPADMGDAEKGEEKPARAGRRKAELEAA